jgi:hypothetical protein
MDEDKEQLRLLASFHFVVAGLAVAFTPLPGYFLALGILIVTGGLGLEPSSPGTLSPHVYGWACVTVGGLGVWFVMVMAPLLASAGRNLARYRRYTFCLGVACIGTAFIPFGTILGVLTILVLTCDSVKRLFGRGKQRRLVLEKAP